MRFAIRDDDTCYFTRPEELEQAYFWLPAKAPVSLAVTPFAVESFYPGDPVKFHQGEKPRPLGENREVVAYLREGARNGRWSFLCHGFTHEYRRANRQLIAECIWKPVEQLKSEMKIARDYLEDQLGDPIDTYVPPGNALSSGALEAMDGVFEGALAAIPLRRWHEFLPDWRLWPCLARRAWQQLLWSGPGLFPQQVGRIRMLASTPLTTASDWNAIVARFHRCKEAGADFCVSVHYWELKNEVLGNLRRLVDLAASAGCEFTTSRALLDGPLHTVAAAG